MTILNQIYEVDFKGFSYGFRPGRSPHQALDALTVGTNGLVGLGIDGAGGGQIITLGRSSLSVFIGWYPVTKRSEPPIPDLQRLICRMRAGRTVTATFSRGRIHATSPRSSLSWRTR